MNRGSGIAPRQGSLLILMIDVTSFNKHPGLILCKTACREEMHFITIFESYTLNKQRLLIDNGSKTEKVWIIKKVIFLNTVRMSVREYFYG